MPYVTAKLDALTPKIGSIHAITTINGAAPTATVTGDRFVLTTNDGLTWIVHASSPVTFNVSGSALTAMSVHELRYPPAGRPEVSDPV